MKRRATRDPVRLVLFDTALGTCGLAWTERGIREVQLPEETREATLERLRARAGAPMAAEAERPEAWVSDAMAALCRHVSGAPQDLRALPVDLDGVPPFHAKVYAAAREIRSGATVTYGELAAKAGAGGASRAVGQAMANNPVPIVVPCHRVLAAGNRPGGFSAYGGRVTKARLLALEGAMLPGTETLTLFEGDARLPFSSEAALSHVTSKDKRFSRTIAKIGPFRLKLRDSYSPFHSLTDSILHQQITGKAAAAIGARLRATFGSDGFPSPEQILRARAPKLRSAGLSASKAAAMKDLAAKVLDGTVPTFEAMHGMADEEIVDRLTAVRGIGRWTVEMLLIFRLGRPDVLPATDYGIRKGFARAFGKKDLPAPSDILRYGERWRPFRTLASWYLWRAAELLDS